MYIYLNKKLHRFIRYYTNDNYCRGITISSPLEKKLGARVTQKFYDRFKVAIGIRFHFRQGYVQLGVWEAYMLYLIFLQELQRYKQEIEKISHHEYGHINDPQERTEKMVQDAIKEFVEKRQKN